MAWTLDPHHPKRPKACSPLPPDAPFPAHPVPPLQLYGMDVRMLDPRRPKSQKLTPPEQEERLVPYQEFLPFMPPMMVSYDKQLLGLSRVSVEPSRLESTCLIFASGVDLFYTRVAPARKYDSLEDDFSYGLLVVALVGLGVGAAVMQRFTKSSMLAQKWN